jgi:hypothetical protein
MTVEMPETLRRHLDRRFGQQCRGPLLEGVAALLHPRPNRHKAELVVHMVADGMRADPLSQLAWWFPQDHPDCRPQHALNACRIAIWMARAQGMDEATMGLAGLMYDIGMYDHRVEQAVHHDEPLSAPAMEALRQHPVRGAIRLSDLEFPAEAQHAAREHHERPDGSGYPDGLTRNRLTREGVLFQLIDSFLGQVEPRPYRARRSPADAMARLLLQAERGHYDLPAFRTFASVFGVFPIGTVVALSSGAFGVVSGVNTLDPQRPQVMLLSDNQGNPAANSIPVNLGEKPALRVVEAY